MKVFAVTTNLTLEQKPSWFDEIREKYNQSFDLHITLKQPCFINEDERLILKERISEFLQSKKFNTITLLFDKVVFDKGKNGWTIMINCQSNEIVNLQTQLCEELRAHRNYVKPETEEYERNFVPHMTFANDLSDSQYEVIKSMFSGHCECRGVVNKLLLLIASEDSKEVMEQIEYKLSTS